MRGIVEVVDPADPASAEIDVDPPQTDWVASGIDVDADHPGANAPQQPPDAANGARLWQQITSRPAAEVAAVLDLRRSSPSDVYARLVSPDLPESPALGGLSPAARWDVVAYLWRESTTPEALQRGAELYRRDCTGCHGPTGQGDGPGAAALEQQHAMEGMEGMEDMAGMAKPPTDFTDLAAQAGASDLLYYAKLVRGGMGTSMPYWGTIYTEDELWAVIAYLRSLVFANLP
jgi:mono/diheme cytochrome c family protein